MKGVHCNMSAVPDFVYSVHWVTQKAMFTEVLLALVVGGVIYFLVQRSKRHQLKSEDGWWGEGTPPDREEDVSIRPYTVRTDKEELEVRCGEGLWA